MLYSQVFVPFSCFCYVQGLRIFTVAGLKSVQGVSQHLTLVLKPCGRQCTCPNYWINGREIGIKDS